ALEGFRSLDEPLHFLQLLFLRERRRLELVLDPALGGFDVRESGDRSEDQRHGGCRSHQVSTHFAFLPRPFTYPRAARTPGRAEFLVQTQRKTPSAYTNAIAVAQ